MTHLTRCVVDRGYRHQMSYTIKQLRQTSDDQLIAVHDQVAVGVAPSVNYYLDELRRREMAAVMRSSNRLAQASLMLALMNTVVAVVAVVVAVTFGGGG